jgi:hypothetical protein
MERTPIKSSSIASIGYDPETQILEVEFRHGGAIYHYAKVPPEKHAALMASDSIGKHFHAYIRTHPDHPFTKVEASGEAKEAKA